MVIVKLRSWHWLGYEDNRLHEHREAAAQIDFTAYTKFFLPWEMSLHPDHRAAARMCR